MKILSLALASTALALFACSPTPADDNEAKRETTIEPDTAVEAHSGHMLEGYIAVTDALYKDDLAAAKEAAKAMTDHDEEGALAESAKQITEAKDIAAAREVFKKLSAEAIKVAKTDEEAKYTVMNCPMVIGGGGDWLSADGKVNNPYFGAAMAHCGGPKQP